MPIRIEKHHGWLAGLVVVLSGCSENISDAPKPNQPPVTHLALRSAAPDSLSPTTSRQTLHWWGDDPDGRVVGFIYTFNPQAQNLPTWASNAVDADWTFTAETQETFTLRLAGTDTNYTFWVKAVDDQDATDPSGARQTYPIVNSSPTVEFPTGTDVPETTFTVANFTWAAADLDGDDTIARFEYALDDTGAATWTQLPPALTSLTLGAQAGLTEGRHVFYLRAIDIAGARSRIISMPRSAQSTWYVRAPRSKFLVIDDYNIADNAAGFYHAILRDLVGDFDVWDIKRDNRALVPASSEAFARTLQLFERIFWYTDTEPNLEKAQVGVPPYLDRGGKIFMLASFQEFTTNQGDPLDFSPVDSLGGRIARLTRNQIIAPAPPFASAGFPQLRVSASIIPNVFPLIPKISADTLYVLPPNPALWPGTPVMGVVDGASSFVFFGIPLAAADGLGTVRTVFDKILNDIF